MELDMERVLDAFGAGDRQRGGQLLMDLAARLEYARSQHHWQGRGADYALTAVEGETAELWQAVRGHEGLRRVYDEALDGAVVNIRTAGREWE